MRTCTKIHEIEVFSLFFILNYQNNNKNKHMRKTCKPDICTRIESKLSSVENETLLIIYLSPTNDSNITNVVYFFCTEKITLLMNLSKSRGYWSTSYI